MWLVCVIKVQRKGEKSIFQNYPWVSNHVSEHYHQLRRRTISAQMAMQIDISCEWALEREAEISSHTHRESPLKARWFIRWSKCTGNDHKAPGSIFHYDVDSIASVSWYRIHYIKQLTQPLINKTETSYECEFHLPKAAKGFNFALFTLEIEQSSIQILNLNLQVRFTKLSIFLSFFFFFILHARFAELNSPCKSVI